MFLQIHYWWHCMQQGFMANKTNESSRGKLWQKNCTPQGVTTRCDIQAEGGLHLQQCKCRATPSTGWQRDHVYHCGRKLRDSELIFKDLQLWCHTALINSLSSSSSSLIVKICKVCRWNILHAHFDVILSLISTLGRHEGYSQELQNKTTTTTSKPSHETLKAETNDR